MYALDYPTLQEEDLSSIYSITTVVDVAFCLALLWEYRGFENDFPSMLSVFAIQHDFFRHSSCVCDSAMTFSQAFQQLDACQGERRLFRQPCWWDLSVLVLWDLCITHGNVSKCRVHVSDKSIRVHSGSVVDERYIDGVSRRDGDLIEGISCRDLN